MFNIAFQYVNPPQARANLLFKSHRSGNDIAQPVNEIRLAPNERLLVLMCLRGREVISHIAWGRKGNRAGTALTRLNFDRITDLSNPIDLRAVRGSGYMDDMLGFFEGREVFATSEEAAELIVRLRATFAEIDKFIAESIADYSLIDSLSSHERTIVRQEHDAVEMALRIAGMIPRKSYRWSPTQQGKENITSFFSGLKPEKFDEDDVVRWDVDKIPGFEVISKDVFGHYVLRDGSTVLHTFHANKTALENTLGCDLIYFNEQHKSFAFIQYKMAEPQGQTHIFRFPNAQLTEEIGRMERLFEVVQADLAASRSAFLVS